MITTYFLPFLITVIVWWASRWTMVASLRRLGYLRGEGLNTPLAAELAAMRECLAVEDPDSTRPVRRLTRVFVGASLGAALAFAWACYGLASLFL